MSDPASPPEPLDELFATRGSTSIEPPRSLALPEEVDDRRRSAPQVVVRPRPTADDRVRRLAAPAWVTATCLFTCVAYYIVMVLQGVDAMWPDPADLLKWGANYAPFTWNGQLWRLITCMFMHAGVIHLAVNGWALWSAGRILERLVGSIGFLIIYLASGIAGSLASLWWNGSIVSVGASGAIFGVLGAFATFIWNRSDSFPPTALSQLRSSLVSCIGFNLLLGASIPGIDQAAHVGGLIAGAIIGALLSQRLDQQSLARRWRKNLVAGVVAGGVLGSLVAWHPAPPPDLQHEMTVYAQTAPPLVRRFRDRFEAVRKKKLTEPQLAKSLQEEILPPWQELRQHFESLVNIPQRSREEVHLVRTELKLREESWLALLAALRQNDQAQFDVFQAKWRQAEILNQRLRRLDQ